MAATLPVTGMDLAVEAVTFGELGQDRMQLHLFPLAERRQHPGLVTCGDTLASPFAATTEVVRRIHQNSSGVRAVAFFQFASAIPLGIYAATVYARQLRLGIRVPGPVISLVGA